MSMSNATDHALRTICMFFPFLVAPVASELIAEAQEVMRPFQKDVSITQALEDDTFVSAFAEGIAAGIACLAVMYLNCRHKKKKKSVDKLGCELPVQPTKEPPSRKTSVVRPPRSTLSNTSAEELSRKAAERNRLTEILHSHVRRLDLHRANLALAEIEATCGVPTLADYSTIIALCARSNDPIGAQKWLQRLREKGLEANSVCFNSVINAYAKQGDLKQATLMAADMAQSNVGFDTVTFNTLIDASVRSDDAESAQLWMKRMLAAGVRASVVSFGSVMRACAKAGLKEDLEMWLKHADELGIELNMICFSAVINAFAKNGDLQAAEQWLERMLKRNVPTSVHCYTGMIDAVLKIGNIERAEKLVDRMRATNVEPDGGVYSWLVTAAVASGDLAKAQKWLDDATVAGVKLNRQARSSIVMAKLTVSETQLAAAAAKPSTDSAAVVKGEVAVVQVSDADLNDAIGKRYVGTVKEYIACKFGYITCEETHALFKKDVFLSSSDNPEQFAKGQKVSFVLQVDRRRGLPRACNLEVFTASKD